VISLLINNYYGGDQDRVLPQSRGLLGAADVGARDL
jgi:hypothetical protein